MSLIKAVIASTRNIRRTPTARITHGHYLPLKFRFCSQVRFSAFFRDPVERVISSYHHHLRRRELIPDDLDVLEFARTPRRRNLYHKYLRGFPLNRFDFLGITEDFDNSMEQFSRFLGMTSLPSYGSRRVNPEKLDAGDRYEIPQRIRDQIRVLNGKDIAIYDAVLERCGRN